MAMAPPKPRTISATTESSNKNCSLCQSNFGFFKRRKHSCINCGITNLCQGCATTWHKSMVPPTFYCQKGTSDSSSAAINSSNSTTVTVCTACDWSAKSFQQALLKGDMTEARYLYKHHNINLRTPYNFLEKGKKKEVL